MKASTTLNDMEKIFKNVFGKNYSNTIDLTKDDVSGNMWDGVV